jgi:soluble lytic murein transglycosylase-like protein
MGKFTSLTITVPDVRKTFQNYSTPAAKAANIRVIQQINRDFGASCEKWGNVFEIEKGVLIAFIATESGGNPKIVSFVGCCYGLMQVSPESVFEVANKFQRTGVELPESCRAVLSRIPNLFSTGRMSSATRQAIVKRLFEPDFNIMCGTMVLRWLLERFSTFLTGAQLNKAIIGYNAGAYSRSINVSATQPIKTPVDTTTYVSMRTVPAESRNYLVKMLGVDGFLQLIYKDKAI